MYGNCIICGCPILDYMEMCFKCENLYNRLYGDITNTYADNADKYDMKKETLNELVDDLLRNNEKSPEIKHESINDAFDAFDGWWDTSNVKKQPDSIQNNIDNYDPVKKLLDSFPDLAPYNPVVVPTDDLKEHLSELEQRISKMECEIEDLKYQNKIAIYHSRSGFYNKIEYWYEFLYPNSIPTGFLNVPTSIYYEYGGSFRDAIKKLKSNGFTIIEGVPL